MRIFTKIFAVAAAVGLCVGGAQAAFDFTDTVNSPRLIYIDGEGVEGVDCWNLYTSPPGAPPWPAHHNNRVPDPSCTDYANGPNADWSDPSNDYWATATHQSGLKWRITTTNAV